MTLKESRLTRLIQIKDLIRLIRNQRFLTQAKPHLSRITNIITTLYGEARAGIQSEGGDKAMFAWVIHQDFGEEAREVAKVYAPHKMKVDTFLDFVWEQTNHINHDWTKNKSVELRTNKPPRSSMMGDIFCVFYTGLFGQPKAEWYRVGWSGFHPWTPEGE